MAYNQVQCEMCCKEQAVGCCNICGNFCESCLVIHKKGRAFQTHILKTYGKDGYNPKRILYDITEEMCKHHPTERALLFCKIHELMICGLCFRSDHISCGHEVIDLCQEAGFIDYDPSNGMSAALNEIQDENKRMKEEAGRQKKRSNVNAMKCNKELDDLEDRLKRKVEDTIIRFRQETRTELNNELKQVKQDLDNSEKTRKTLCEELKQVNKNLAHSQKTRKVLKLDLLTAKQGKKKYEKRYHPFPGKPYKGGTFVGRLSNDVEGLAICRMLKTTFRRGQMFTIGKDERVIMDGVSLYGGNWFAITLFPSYISYTQTVKAELATKGITEWTIDKTEKLEGTFTVAVP
ncbi:uncharacterized protein LOC128241311 [Mya arenaria]|uniref:uncharacterized protein LOC128241311 n=1 Tax=Mya arenaria TaxID=6604 RepID=UPI0022E35EDB|nr:uncharacterized protein LOC128241311 [Mya arenaria]